MAVLGMAVGVWVKAETVQGVTTMLLLACRCSAACGSRSKAMPPAMQAMAPDSQIWLGELGRFPFLPGADFPGRGISVAARLVVRS